MLRVSKYLVIVDRHRIMHNVSNCPNFLLQCHFLLRGRLNQPLLLLLEVKLLLHQVICVFLGLLLRSNLLLDFIDFRVDLCCGILSCVENQYLVSLQEWEKGTSLVR
jgi:hypothetical protein